MKEDKTKIKLCSCGVNYYVWEQHKPECKDFKEFLRFQIDEKSE